MTTPNPLDPRLDTHPLTSLGLAVHDTDLHSSSIATHTDCAREFMFSELFHLQRPGTYSRALSTGEMFHAFMCNYVIYGSVTSAARAVEDVLAKHSDRLWRISNNGVLPDGRLVAELMDVIQRDADLAGALGAFTAGRVPWPGDGTDAKDWSLVCAEQVFRVRTSIPNICVRVMFDLVMRHVPTGATWVIDYKTSSFSPSEEVAKFTVAVQPALYLAVARLLFPSVHGICYTVIRKPTITLKRNQTSDDYITEVGEWMQGTGRHTDKAQKWTDDPTVVQHWVREVDYTSLARKLSDAARAMKVFPSLNEFPTNEKACRRFNSLCQYAPLCTTSTTSWAMLVNDYVVTHRDDPPEPADAEDYTPVTDRTDLVLDISKFTDLSSPALEKIE